MCDVMVGCSPDITNWQTGCTARIRLTREDRGRRGGEQRAMYYYYCYIRSTTPAVVTQGKHLEQS